MIPFFSLHIREVVLEIIEGFWPDCRILFLYSVEQANNTVFIVFL